MTAVSSWKENWVSVVELCLTHTHTTILSPLILEQIEVTFAVVNSTVCVHYIL
jgi:hypothetical protein